MSRRSRWWRVLAGPAVGAVLVAGCSAPSVGTPDPKTAEHTESEAPLVGWDTYRRLDRLPNLPGGSRTLEFSSFDRSGGTYEAYTGNQNGSGGCLSTGGAGCVIAQDAGAGEISSIWFTNDVNGVRGDVSAMGDIQIELDGRTVLDAPLQSVVDGRLGAPYVFPLVANAEQAAGGVYLKVPMAYRDSMRISVQAKLKYYHVYYRHFPDANGVRTFDPSDRADDVVTLLRAAGTRDPKPAMPDTHNDIHTVDLPPGAEVPVATPTGSGSILALRLRLPTDSDEVRAGLQLRITFDGHQTVDAPVGEFFGSGLGAAPVRSLLFAADPNGWMSSWWPMPYGHDAKVSLVNTTKNPVTGVQTDVASAPDPRWAKALDNRSVGYFTTISRAEPTTSGKDWIFADQHGHGKVVGVNETMRGTRTPTSFSPAVPTFLEGADRVYVDGLRSPQLYGTGTEDFYEGGWYYLAHIEWYPDNPAEPDHFPVGGTIYTAPFTGMPAHRDAGPGCPDYCLSTYRVMLADAIGYRSGIRFGMEHGKRDLIDADYSSTTFLYTQPDAATTGSDSIDLADPASRAQHAYADPDSTQYHLVSQYEGTEDAVAVPGTVEVGSGRVTFRLRIRPDNHGVVLRRISDQIAGNQSAQVLVDDKPAGTWLQARSNDIHRWLEDAYLLPESTTAGKTEITVTLTPTTGAPPWTATQYSADPLAG
ncbi:glycoside hydrolase family 172 protein [Nocardia sp. NBC_00403]|uniref:glycoside hydrolase family 172 protein n=1 Tax=Nocardia sp. NBC_00403 TaxID=2975990 RepID=UPI003FA591E0